ncbi:hypothetical protein [uncultured Friedmanniella sp.]|uniref:hypothetical protein n=1 Tax=uncultured Friedmanniella sp. TaxID=335381 RepID=UPI0035CB5B03
MDLRALELGPLWVLSALSGTGNRFDARELSAFWDALVAVALRTPEPARGLLTSLTDDRTGLLLAFELDDRPLVSGFAAVVRALASLEPAVAEDYRIALLRIGTSLGRSRGPYGERISASDTQLLLLVAELLEIRSARLSDDQLV